MHCWFWYPSLPSLSSLFLPFSSFPSPSAPRTSDYEYSIQEHHHLGCIVGFGLRPLPILPPFLFSPPLPSYPPSFPFSAPLSSPNLSKIGSGAVVMCILLVLRVKLFGMLRQGQYASAATTFFLIRAPFIPFEYLFYSSLFIFSSFYIPYLVIILFPFCLFFFLFFLMC